jgi:phage baseplate assembly protein W
MPRYSDIDLFLVKNDLTNDITFKQDLQAIAQSLTNIALTRKGELHFKPDFGTDLVETLQVAVSEIALNLLKETVKSQLETNDTRATINNIEIIRESDTYVVTIHFSPVGDSTEGTASFTI